LREFSLRLEPAALDVKGKCANHFATEALKKYKQNFKVSTEGCSFVIGKLVAKWAFA
jgi:hypothetical protein